MTTIIKLVFFWGLPHFFLLLLIPFMPHKRVRFHWQQLNNSEQRQQKKLIEFIWRIKSCVLCVLNKLIKRPYIMNETTHNIKAWEKLAVATLCHFPSEYFIKFALAQKIWISTVRWDSLKVKRVNFRGNLLTERLKIQDACANSTPFASSKHETLLPLQRMFYDLKCTLVISSLSTQAK